VEHKKIEIYEKKTPIEHILLRPGMYVGEIESKQTEIWVYDDNLKKMMKTPLIYSPALIKVYLN
jgi:DNA topoisomerase-2